jgi:hypothetical protein
MPEQPNSHDSISQGMPNRGTKMIPFANASTTTTGWQSVLQASQQQRAHAKVDEILYHADDVSQLDS